jgi:hypothetical protein
MAKDPMTVFFVLAVADVSYVFLVLQQYPVSLILDKALTHLGDVQIGILSFCEQAVLVFHHVLVFWSEPMETRLRRDVDDIDPKSLDTSPIAQLRSPDLHDGLIALQGMERQTEDVIRIVGTIQIRLAHVRM